MYIDAQLIDDARKRRFQAVLVWELDRLSREEPLAILTLVERLKSSGVKVLSYQESWTEAPGELAKIIYCLPHHLLHLLLNTDIGSYGKRAPSQ